MVMRNMAEGQTIPNVEVGYAIVRGNDPFAVGVEAATKAMESITEHPLSVFLVHIRGEEGLSEVLAGISTIVEDAPVIGVASKQTGTERVDIEVSSVAVASPFLTLNVGIGGGLAENWKSALKDAIESDDIDRFFGKDREDNWRSLVDVGRSVFGMILTTSPDSDTPLDMTSLLTEVRAKSDNRIPFTGGSALNISGARTSRVIFNQEIYSDALLLIIIDTNLRIGTSIAHGFSLSDEKLIVTKIRSRTISEFNDNPAGEELEKFGDTKSLNLGIVDTYGSCRHVLIEEIDLKKGVKISRSIPKGTILTVLHPDGNDLEEAGIEAFNKALIRGSIEEPILCILFSSIFRRGMLSKQAADDVENVRSFRPDMYIVGFDTGEEVGLTDEGANRHNHKTVAVLVLGQKLSYAAEVA
ncbi:MAG: hypothetical protein KAR33_06510, partial [Candidatus Thorarchaeota archaeon]|nr:hypothetical protein [Candidatus Thorarchaeota archaeon]